MDHSAEDRQHGPLSVDDTLGDDYDEFGLLHENAREWNLSVDPPPQVTRRQVEVGAGRPLSAIVWGHEEPEVVFLHGGGQNAHTWDTVALALGRPAVAFDLPGHGHSYSRPDRNYGPWWNAEALEVALPQLAPKASIVVGMSLGGATLIRLAATRPDLVRRAVIVDVTPQVNDPTRGFTTEERGSVLLIGGPPTYESFEAMAEATVKLSPLRPAAAVRRGVRHNSYRLPDGTWRWRYDLFGERDPSAGNWSDFVPLWADVSRITVPTMLVRGGKYTFVTDDDVAEMKRRLPSIRVEVVDGAGHAVQSDKPLELVRLIQDFERA
ncbi:MAG: putative hydrolase [Acidimicrobiia bacterium]|nr:putative hydrolase [Acidimicrobiia bacterium]